MRALILCLCLTLAATAARADAPTADAQASARAEYELGTAAYTSGRYVVAAQHFAAAYALTPLPPLLFNEAQAWRLQFEISRDRPAGERAVVLFRRYLSTPGLSADERREPTERLLSVESALGPAKSSAMPPPPSRRGLWIGLGVGAAVVVGALAVGLGVGLSDRSTSGPTVTPRW